MKLKRKFRTFGRNNNRNHGNSVVAKYFETEVQNHGHGSMPTTAVAPIQRLGHHVRRPIHCNQELSATSRSPPKRRTDNHMFLEPWILARDPEIAAREKLPQAILEQSLRHHHTPETTNRNHLPTTLRHGARR